MRWRESPNGLPPSRRSFCAIVTANHCSTRRALPAISRPHILPCGSASKRACRPRLLPLQAEFLILFADDETIQHKPLDEDDFFIVLQFPRDLANGIGGSIQCEIQGRTKKARKYNALGPEINADSVVFHMFLVDDAAAGPNDVCTGEWSGLKKVQNLPRNVQRKRSDHFVPELRHNGVHKCFIGSNVPQYRDDLFSEFLLRTLHEFERHA